MQEKGRDVSDYWLVCVLYCHHLQEEPLLMYAGTLQSNAQQLLV
jgi:hypothetical protein